MAETYNYSKNNDDSFASIFNTNSNGIIYNGRGKLISFNINEVKKEINAYKTDENTIVITHVARYHHEKTKNYLSKVSIKSSHKVQMPFY